MPRLQNQCYDGSDKVKVFIDLFAGLGGASQAFMEHPEWKVIRIDNNQDLLSETDGLQIMDLTQTDEVIRMIESQFVNGCSLNCEKLVIWASPPCQQYSIANPTRTPEDFDNTLLLSTLHIIEHFNPDAWIIENVKGAIEEFNDIIGQPWRQRINAMFLWGDFGLLAFKDIDSIRHHRKLDAKGSRKLRPNFRALVPFPVSLALLNVFEHQRTLLDWME